MEKRLETIANETRQLNDSAYGLNLYGKPLYEVNNGLIDVYEQRKDIGMIQNLYSTIKVFENRVKVDNYNKNNK